MQQVFHSNIFSYKPESTQGERRLQECCWDERMENERPFLVRQLVGTRRSVCYSLPFFMYMHTATVVWGNDK